MRGFEIFLLLIQVNQLKERIMIDIDWKKKKRQKVTLLIMILSIPEKWKCVHFPRFFFPRNRIARVLYCPYYDCTMAHA